MSIFKKSRNNILFAVVCIATGCSIQKETYNKAKHDIVFKKCSIKDIEFENERVYIKRCEDIITNDSIVISLINNKRVVFVDFSKDLTQEKNVKYEYIGLILNSKYVLLSLTGYENEKYIVVNIQNGKYTELWSPPIISSDNEYAVCYSASLFNASMPNGIQLWQIENNEFSKVWELPIDDWSPGYITWTGNKLIVERKFNVIEKGVIKTKKHDYTLCTWSVVN